MQVFAAERGAGKTHKLVEWAREDVANRLIIEPDSARVKFMRGKYPDVRFCSALDLQTSGITRRVGLGLAIDNYEEFTVLPVPYRSLVEIVSINGEPVEQGAQNVLDEVRKLL